MKMAHPPGLEPGTTGLEIRCSIQLSYGCVTVKITQSGSMSEGILEPGDLFNREQSRAPTFASFFGDT